MIEKKFWNEKQVADYLNRSPQTIRAWRQKGIGPEYITDPQGRVHYPINKVKDWMEQAMIQEK